MDDQVPDEVDDTSGEHWLARDFEAHRPRLRAVAHRVLGSAADADDAVQEAWLRLSRSDPGDIANLGGWLTTVVGRISLDMLQARSSRREDSWDTELAGLVAGGDPRTAPTQRPVPTADPALEVELADSVGMALLVVLDTLGPAERLAFVLHDLFGMPFEQIADIIDRSPAATRQLASRARRRVRAAGPEVGAGGGVGEAGGARPRAVVSAFLSAARGGDFAALLRLLDPDVVMTSDEAAIAMGSPAVLEGQLAVAERFSGSAQAARLAAFDGGIGAVWMLHGAPKVAFRFTVREGHVVGIHLVADAARLEAFDIDYLRD
ncbi:sigma-70 family RNA polymerase sigma factor [Terrabacter sp. MAHUQ-38]|uniref:sigma-70 family RNA polymerase sigma factor n=1 Tax=unclassified Terrabacter TaxID=2630222 RepID=UPI00165DB0AE|nr:sigma-70 family RNA polymerase sigma factor [Terrabacter sp. MAHUQ-38]MBC9820593.1 sigma-70 family RNA polymerase sigma factor [Terrabacter sp. MAHUQ-38]